MTTTPTERIEHLLEGFDNAITNAGDDYNAGYLKAMRHEFKTLAAALTTPPAAPASAVVTKERVIDRLWESSGHGTRREDIVAAFEAGVEHDGSALETLLAVAHHFGFDEAAERAQPGYDGTGPASATIIAAIERASLEAATRPSKDAKFLLVSMDDDRYGHPAFCKDEAAVSAALLPLMFFLQDGETLDADHAEQFKGNLESLLEDGFLQFEGDPSIYLYRLRAASTGGDAK